MVVKIWGCRGSIPSPGRDTVRYGGESTCLEIIINGRRIIVDAGSGIRRLGKRMLQEGSAGEANFLLTHMHWDHLAGFPFFRPAYLPGYRFNLCGAADPQGAVLKYLRHQMDPPYFPVDFSILKAEFHEACDCERGNCRHMLPGIEEARCESIALNHPNGGFGFKLTEAGRSFIFLTDNELGFRHPEGLPREDYVELCRGAELLIHDAQYTDAQYKVTRSWGHSTFGDAVDLALEAGVLRLGLFHHDPDRTDDELDEIVTWCRARIAAAGSQLECFACADGMELEV